MANGQSKWTGADIVDKVDGRRARGDITRHRTALCAAQIATVSGLESISIAQLAAETGLSKSGILTVFPNRTAIQLAAVESARDVVIEQVVAPAMSETPGKPRLTAVINNWFAYVRARVFPGGCFFVTVANEYGSQQGELADVVRATIVEWGVAVEDELLVDQPATRSARQSAHRDAFRLDAYMTAANTRYSFYHDDGDLEMARHACLEVIDTRSGAYR